jgi:hypothetical protein
MHWSVCLGDDCSPAPREKTAEIDSAMSGGPLFKSQESVKGQHVFLRQNPKLQLC